MGAPYIYIYIYIYDISRLRVKFEILTPKVSKLYRFVGSWPVSVQWRDSFGSKSVWQAVLHWHNQSESLAQRPKLYLLLSTVFFLLTTGRDYGIIWRDEQCTARESDIPDTSVQDSMLLPSRFCLYSRTPQNERRYSCSSLNVRYQVNSCSFVSVVFKCVFWIMLFS